GSLEERPGHGSGSSKLFGREEASRSPAAIIRILGELCDLAQAPYVKVATVDNGFFANWLQVLDARLFAAEDAIVEPDWVLTGKEREFNYGEAGDDLFGAIFQEPEQEGCKSGQFFVATHRYNLLLVNVFRGNFLRGERALNRRKLYAAAAQRLLRPRPEVLRLRDEALAQVTRSTGAPLIGVHKRVDNPGTARMQLTQVMPSTEAFVRAVQLLAERRSPGRGAQEAVVVLATDDLGALQAFRAAFGDRLVVRPGVERCTGGVNSQNLPLEVHGQPGKRLRPSDAQDCMVDMLLLAACDAFVHADSNVTIAAGIMNPFAEAVHVLDLVPEAALSGEASGEAWPGYRRCRLPV
ncbi:unnamed protein product, partial [Polarella glacialis]